MLTASSEEATAIYGRFQNIYRYIQFKIDNTGSLSLIDFKMQMSPTGKIDTSSYRKPISLRISNQHFHSVPKQITLEMKLNECTINAAKKNYTNCTLYKHPQKQ